MNTMLGIFALVVISGYLTVDTILNSNEEEL